MLHVMKQLNRGLLEICTGPFDHVDLGVERIFKVATPAKLKIRSDTIAVLATHLTNQILSCVEAQDRVNGYPIIKESKR